MVQRIRNYSHCQLKQTFTSDYALFFYNIT